MTANDDTESEPDDFTLIEQFSDTQLGQLHALVQAQWWGGQRSLEEVKLMAENTSLMIGLVDSHDRLVGFCRVLTDFAFRATIYDVMVDERLQGRGLGKRLMEALCGHPKLQRVSFLYLCCEPAMFPFYRQWGFTVHEGRTEWMIKVQREE